MKKRLTIILLLAFACTVSKGQTPYKNFFLTKNITNAEITVDAFEYITIFTLKREGVLLEELLVDSLKKCCKLYGYMPSGRIRYMGDLNFAGEKDGVSISFDKKGRYLAFSTFKSGEHHGISRHYRKGILSASLNYYEGEKSGSFIYLNKKGNPTIIEEHPPNSLESKREKYYPNGQIEREEYFYDGLRAGVHLTYHKNGQLAAEIPYKNGEIHGKMKVYSKKGKLERVILYENGRFVSEEKMER